LFGCGQALLLALEFGDVHVGEKHRLGVGGAGNDAHKTLTGQR